MDAQRLGSSLAHRSGENRKMNWCSLPISLEGDWKLFGPTMLVRLLGAHTEGSFHLMRATNTPAYRGGSHHRISMSMTSKCLAAACCLACFLPLSLAAQEGLLPIPGRVATLAFFLDSTDTLEQGTLWFTSVATYRRAPGGKELDIPAVGISFGLARRVQVDFSIPYFRTEYGSDFRMNGIGDKFLSAKFRVRDADSGKLGIAFEPTLEILGKGSLAAGELGPKKYNVALPVIIQKNFSRFNLYSEVGYITRGAVFVGVGSDAPIYRKLGGGINCALFPGHSI